MQEFINVFLKLFFVLTPFFVLSAFIALTTGYADSAKKRVAVKATAAVLTASFGLLLFGGYIFSVLGITLDAFRVGAGTLLFLSAVALVTGSGSRQKAEEDRSIAVVPLAMPITVGPATTGVLLLMGAELHGMRETVVVGGALLAAVLSLGGMLTQAGRIERWLGDTGLAILSKLTGLVLASLAAQMILTGIRGFLAPA